LATVRTFCEQVMLAKKRADRNREKRRDPVRIDRRERGASKRRRVTTAPPPPPSWELAAN
jgi:hypothetical protein